MKTINILATILLISLLATTVLANITIESFDEGTVKKKETKTEEKLIENENKTEIKIEKKYNRIYNHKIKLKEVANDNARFNRKDNTESAEKLNTNEFIVGNRVYKKTQKCNPYNETIIIEGLEWNAVNFTFDPIFTSTEQLNNGCINYYNKYTIQNNETSGKGKLINSWTETEFNNNILDENTEIYKKSIIAVTE